MQFAPTDLVGYCVGLAAIVFAIVIYYRSKLDLEMLKTESKLDIERLKTEIDKLNEAFRLFRENTKKVFGSLNDIAFGSLLRVKNFPAHSQALASQRESLVGAISAIRLITAREGDPTFQGEYIAGGDLGAIEDSPGCVEVWIITPDLRPDIEEDDLILSVARNLAHGRRYIYVVPHDIAADRPPRLAEFVRRKVEDDDVQGVVDRLSIVKIARAENTELFANGLITLYQIKQGDESAALTTIGFDEVVLPNERRGSLWQRQHEAKAKTLMAMVQQAVHRGEKVDHAVKQTDNATKP